MRSSRSPRASSTQWNLWTPFAEVLPGGTVTVESFIQKVALTSIGMPVCQGVVLYKTGSHHFIDPHKSVARAVIKQAFPEVNVGVAPLDKEQLEDLLAHKMAHPIKTNVMVGYATDVAMPARLKAANLASAAVRLPAKSDGEAFLAAGIRTQLIGSGPGALAPGMYVPR